MPQLDLTDKTEDTIHSDESHGCLSHRKAAGLDTSQPSEGFESGMYVSGGPCTIGGKPLGP